MKLRILEISYKYNLSHLGSCLTAVDIIDKIYQEYPNDVFVLSSGHAGLALYVVLEKYYGIDAEYLFKKHGVHPNRCLDDRIYCSSGSLGHGLPIAVGMAIAGNKVHCLVSDGEMAEGSIWESLRLITELNIKNIDVYVNCNGFSAYKTVDLEWLKRAISVFSDRVHVIETNFEPFGFLKGIEAHYCKLTKEKYEKIFC